MVVIIPLLEKRGMEKVLSANSDVFLAPTNHLFPFLRELNQEKKFIITLSPVSPPCFRH
jgi:hypothetical protein